MLKDRLSAIEERIAAAARVAGRTREDVTLVAVSKLQPLELVQEAFALGVRDFGENYAQELVQKAHGVPGARWHFIGRLQKNKINMLKPFVTVWQTVDGADAGRAIAARVEGKPTLFLQVNVGEEAQKSGIAPTAVREVFEALEPKIHVAGLMCIPPVGDPAPHFQFMQRLRGESEAQCGHALALSMGMSDDFETAIRYGATHVRIGTLLFGARK